MSGFTNPDGSMISGGILPSGATPSTRSSPGQALALDELGNLLVSLQDPSLAEIRNGQLFYGTTGQESLANATVDSPTSLFNPSNSGKSLLIKSWIVSSGTGSIVGIMFFTTVDPAYGSSLLVKNANPGSANTSVASATFDHANNSEPGAGEFRRIYNQYYIEMIPSGYGILLPKGSAHGITTFMESYATGGIGAQSLLWEEF
jgi:hypothetical protein